MKSSELKVLAHKIVKRTTVKFPAMSVGDFVKLMKLIHAVSINYFFIDRDSN